MDGCIVYLALMMGTSCMDNFLPEEKDAFDRDVNFTTTIFTPQWGIQHFIQVYSIQHNQHYL